jgi:hypothetical protein
MRYWLFIIPIFLFSKCTTNPGDASHKKLKLLILSGRNNHEWQSTTPQLVKMYEESGRFDVEVTEAPDTLSYAILKGFDAVVSNWSAWPEHDYRWPEEAESGLMKFIEEGGGFVLLSMLRVPLFTIGPNIRSWSERPGETAPDMARLYHIKF